ncbi:MAG: methyltransferase domain-containing protein [Candidatus Hydrogenedens sp.]|nr:methyltransferase domain-containing protein [Candidatus Hydrogenedens sp.]
MCTCGRKPFHPERRAAWSEHFFAWAWSRATTPLEKSYGRIKDKLFADLSGEVVEIGPGAGINFRHFPAGVHVRGVEPNPFMHPYLKAAAEESGLTLSLDGGHAEEIHLPDASVDAVVSTLVLCSVYQPELALSEIHRVLKPGGKFYFIEHVAATPGSLMRRAQDFLAPAWRKIGDGCNPNRDTASLLRAAGFGAVSIEERHIKNPFIIVAPHILGTATK